MSLALFRALSRVNALTASLASNPSIFTASSMFAAIYSRLPLPLNGSSGAFAPCRFGAGVSAGCCAAADDDDDAVAALPFDLDRAGGSAGTAGGVAEELRPRAGLRVVVPVAWTLPGLSFRLFRLMLKLLVLVWVLSRPSMSVLV